MHITDNGENNLQLLNIVFEGPEGSGKTALKRLILGKHPIPSMESLSSHEPADQAISIELVQVTDGMSPKKISDSDIIEFLATEAVLSCQDVKEFALLTMTHVSADESDREMPISDAVEIFKNLKRSIEKKLVDMQRCNTNPGAGYFDDSKWYRFIDCGGQPQFQDMLPHLYHGPSLQIVCLRLTDNLEDKSGPCYTAENGEKVIPPDNLRLTNLQFIERACQIAACNPPSKVLIVGTHKDKLEDPDSKIQMLNERLSETYKKYDDVLLRISPSSRILGMNTIAKNEAERAASLKSLQSVLDSAAKLLVTKPIPFKWLITFHLSIWRREGVVSLKDCLAIGEVLGMNREAVTKALTSFKESDVLLYFPDDVPDLVLTNFGPLMERLSKFMMDALVKQPDIILYSKSYDKLRHQGTFNKEFFDNLLRETVSPSQSCTLNNEKLLKLLLCLKLAVKLRNDEYFLPSALSYSTTDIDRTSGDGYVSCGFTSFHNNEKRILPHNFFLTTVIMLIAASNDSDIKQPFKFELRKDDQQHRDRIQLHDTSQAIPGVVILSNKIWWIEVSMKKVSKDHFPSVHKVVKQAIETTSEHLKHTFDIQEVFPCPIEDHHDHYCVLTEKKNHYTCSEDISCTGLVQENMKLWFEGTCIYIIYVYLYLTWIMVFFFCAVHMHKASCTLIAIFISTSL